MVFSTPKCRTEYSDNSKPSVMHHVWRMEYTGYMNLLVKRKKIKSIPVTGLGGL
jgi:hypothetical protein